MAGYPYYPYSVILDIPKNSYAENPKLPQKLSATLNNENQAIISIIEAAQTTLKSIENSQRALYEKVISAEPELVKHILSGRIVNFTKNGGFETSTFVVDEATKITKTIARNMGRYRDKLDSFTQQITKAIQALKNPLTTAELQHIISSIKTNSKITKGIQQQFLTALKENEEAMLKLFVRFRQEEVLISSRQQNSIADILAEVMNEVGETKETLIETLKDTNKGQDIISKLANKIISKHKEKSNPYGIHYIEAAEETVAKLLLEKIKNISTLEDLQKLKFTFRLKDTGENVINDTRTTRGYEALEYIASLGNSLLTDEEKKKYAIQIMRTGDKRTRVTKKLVYVLKTKSGERKMTVNQEDYKQLVNSPFFQTTFPDLFFQIEESEELVDNKEDDLINFNINTGEGMQERVSFAFSDKLISNIEWDQKAYGGLASVKIEGGNLFSLTTLLSQFSSSSVHANLNDLIFLLLNLSSGSALSGVISQGVNLEKFISSIIISHIYLLAFNPAALKNNIEELDSDIKSLNNNTIYFHHIDTGIIPSYELLRRAYNQLEQMKKNSETINSNEFVQFSYTPSNFDPYGLYNAALNAYPRQNQAQQRWKMISDSVAHDTIVKIALNILALEKAVT